MKKTFSAILYLTVIYISATILTLINNADFFETLSSLLLMMIFLKIYETF